MSIAEEQTIEQYALRMIEIKQQRADISKKFKAVDDRLKNEYNALESDFLGSLGEATDGVLIGGYNFKRKLTTKLTIADKAAFVEYLHKEQAFDILNASALSQPKSNALWPAGTPLPDFINPFKQVGLSVTKSTDKPRTFT